MNVSRLVEALEEYGDHVTVGYETQDGKFHVIDAVDYTEQHGGVVVLESER